MPPRTYQHVWTRRTRSTASDGRVIYSSHWQDWNVSQQVSSQRKWCGIPQSPGWTPGEWCDPMKSHILIIGHSSPNPFTTDAIASSSSPVVCWRGVRVGVVQNVVVEKRFISGKAINWFHDNFQFVLNSVFVTEEGQAILLIPLALTVAL